MCDFTPDCTGGTDETSDLCGYPCTFQNGYCGFSNVLTDDYDWQRHSQGTASQGTGPSTDATGNSTGVYVYLEASQRRYNKRAVLLSPTYGGSFADCTMVFYYHMYGSNVGSLWLKLDDVNGTTTMWRYEGKLALDHLSHKFIALTSPHFPFVLLSFHPHSRKTVGPGHKNIVF